MSAQAQGTLRPAVSDKDHSIGPATAPVTLVEYGDYECPHCYRAHPIVNAVRGILRDKLRFVFRAFPLTQVHTYSGAPPQNALTGTPGDADGSTQRSCKSENHNAFHSALVRGRNHRRI